MQKSALIPLPLAPTSEPGVDGYARSVRWFPVLLNEECQERCLGGGRAVGSTLSIMNCITSLTGLITWPRHCLAFPKGDRAWSGVMSPEQGTAVREHHCPLSSGSRLNFESVDASREKRSYPTPKQFPRAWTWQFWLGNADCHILCGLCVLELGFVLGYRMYCSLGFFLFLSKELMSIREDRPLASQHSPFPTMASQLCQGANIPVPSMLSSW